MMMFLVVRSYSRVRIPLQTTQGSFVHPDDWWPYTYSIPPSHLRIHVTYCTPTPTPAMWGSSAAGGVLIALLGMATGTAP